MQRRVARYAPLFLWIGVIFFLSSGAGAASETSRFIRPFLEYLFPAASTETITAYHFYIRKFAHFASYAILAWLAIRAFIASSVGIIKNNPLCSALLLAIAVAILDETNQSFLATRTGSVWDVLLDMLGAVTALLSIRLLRAVPTRRAN